MSLEKAVAVLDAANAKNPMNPIDGANPDSSTLVDKKDLGGDTKFDLKSDSLKEKDTEKKEDTEKKPEEEKKPETKEQASQRFAMLAKKEKALLVNQQKLKTQEQELEKRLVPALKFEEAKAACAENPMLALEMLGITYDQLTQFQLNGKMPNSTEIKLKQLEQKLAGKEKADLEAKEREEQERRNNQETANEKKIADFKIQIDDYIKSNSEKYELTNINDASHLIFQKIEEHFHRTNKETGTGILLSVEEAADAVEKFLEAQVEKNLSAKKLAAKVAPQPKEEPKQTPSAQQRTISNDMTGSTPSMLPAKTERDRMNRAMAALSK